MKSIYVVGALGWDMGCAAKVLEIVESKGHGFIYIMAVKNPKNEADCWREVWLEAHAKTRMGPDCNGDLPKGRFKPRKKII